MASETALVLTREAAEAAGLTGEGPFLFPGFPGVWQVGRPLAIRHLDLPTEHEARVRMAEVFGDQQLLAVTSAAPGDADPEGLRGDNHAPSQAELDAARVDDAVDAKAGGRVSTHAEADKVAAELGFEFPAEPRPKLEAKVAVIDQVRAGADPGQALAQLTAEDGEA